MIRTPTRVSYKVCEFWPKTKITVVEFVVVEVVLTEISKHVKKSNQIYHREITCSKSATEYKNINWSRHCTIITVDLEQAHFNL